MSDLKYFEQQDYDTLIGEINYLPISESEQAHLIATIDQLISKFIDSRNELISKKNSCEKRARLLTKENNDLKESLGIATITKEGCENEKN